jgi:RNA polymerase sigma-70 factor (ECF subfamily)
VDDSERAPEQQDVDHQFGRWLAWARSGDPRGFEQLVRWLERPLAGFVRARGADDWEALTNDVLVRAFGRIEQFEGNAVRFRAWIFRIARNALIDEHRRRERRVDAVPTLPHHLPQPLADDDPTAAVEGRERVDAMLAELTDEQREVVLLRIVAGLSVEETAEVVGRRPGAVRTLQHRALARLRRSFPRQAVTR